MKYSEVPQKDRNALERYIKYLEDEISNNLEYELYDNPDFYIIYLNNDTFDAEEDKINKILNDNKHLETSKEILISPKKFKVSYEEKIDNIFNATYYNQINKTLNDYANQKNLKASSNNTNMTSNLSSINKAMREKRQYEFKEI